MRAQLPSTGSLSSAPVLLLLPILTYTLLLLELIIPLVLGFESSSSVLLLPMLCRRRSYCQKGDIFSPAPLRRSGKVYCSSCSAVVKSIVDEIGFNEKDDDDDEAKSSQNSTIIINKTTPSINYVVPDATTVISYTSSRRSVLSTSVAAIAGGLSSVSVLPFPVTKSNVVSAVEATSAFNAGNYNDNDNDNRSRIIGETVISGSGSLPLTVGLGTGPTYEQKYVEAAIGAGYRLFDTAQEYGTVARKR